MFPNSTETTSLHLFSTTNIHSTRPPTTTYTSNDLLQEIQNVFAIIYIAIYSCTLIGTVFYAIYIENKEKNKHHANGSSSNNLKAINELQLASIVNNNTQYNNTNSLDEIELVFGEYVCLLFVDYFYIFFG